MCSVSFRVILMLLTFSFQIMSNVKVDPLDNGGNQETLATWQSSQRTMSQNPSRAPLESALFSSGIAFTFPDPARVTRISEKVEVVEHQDALLACEVEGNPTPNVTWTAPNGTVLQSGTGGTNLTLYNVTRGDSGTYVCKATNELASDSKGALLDVQCEFPMSWLLCSSIMVLVIVYSLLTPFVIIVILWLQEKLRIFYAVKLPDPQCNGNLSQACTGLSPGPHHLDQLSLLPGVLPHTPSPSPQFLLEVLARCFSYLH